MKYSKYGEGHPVYAINLTRTDEILDVEFALKNTYGFIIKDDELIIYFTGEENKNLLIIKKR
jgi:hypothetical protein